MSPTYFFLLFCSLFMICACNKEIHIPPSGLAGAKANSTLAHDHQAVLSDKFKNSEPSIEITGVVLETILQGDFVYAKLKSGNNENWVALIKTDVQIGQKIKVSANSPLKNFHSKSLNRTFDEVYFGKLDAATFVK